METIYIVQYSQATDLSRDDIYKEIPADDIVIAVLLYYIRYHKSHNSST